MTGTRTLWLAGAAFVWLSGAASGEEVVRRISWPELTAANSAPAAAVVVTEGVDAPLLRFVHRGGEVATFELVTIERPPIRTERYALRGRVRYEHVAAGSYLEMWSHLPEGAFFSRSLDDRGPMGRLDGSAGWRPFLLPFFNREGGAPPDKLVFNLVLAGAGVVEFGPVELVQFDPGEDLVVTAGAWWSDSEAGLLGGLVGSAIGILGTIVGLLAAAGRGKGFVLGALRTLAALGLSSLLAGSFAVLIGQPYGVYYPLLLLGVITSLLGFALPRSLSKRYEDLELRRMQALDA